MAARRLLLVLSFIFFLGCGAQESIQDDMILPWDSTAVDSLPSPGNVIDDQIVEALENFREQMSIGWPELGIPPLDPLLLTSLDINITSGETNFYGNLTEVSIKHLSNFSIDLVHSNLLFLKVDIALGLELLDIDGVYDILGAIGVFPIFGDGPFWLGAFDSSLSIEVALGVDEYDELGVSELTIYANFNTTEVDFENIMGGGEMADFVNGVLSSMAPDILQALEDEYMPMIEEALKHEINTILHGGRKNFKDDSVNEYFDYVFANMRRRIIENDEDPLGLPGDSDNFTVSVEYSIRLWLALFGKELEYTLKMAFVHLSFETDVFLLQSELTFAYCNITELGPVHFKEKGAGPLDTPLYNLLANTLVGKLHALVSGTLQEVVCALLEKAFASG